MGGFNKSSKAFGDGQELLERALRAPKGIRIPCSSRSAAITLRARANYLRKIDRALNRDIHPDKSHPMHGNSLFDTLVLRIPAKGSPEENVLYIEPRLVDNFVVEEIT